jgi:hypothetical protein
MMESSLMKNSIRKIINGIFIIFTCTILGVVVYFHIYGVNRILLSDIVAILVLSILTSFAGLIFHSKREPKRLEMAVRLVIHLLAVVGIVLAAASYMRWVLWSMPLSVIRFVGLVVGIWILAHSIIYFQSKMLADSLNKKLIERYKE